MQNSWANASYKVNLISDIGDIKLTYKNSNVNIKRQPPLFSETHYFNTCNCSLWLKIHKMTSAHVSKLFIANRHLHGRFTVVKSLLPGMQKENETELSSRVTRQCVFYRHKVLQWLWHLAASNGQMPRVKKIMDPVVVAETSLTIQHELH